MNRYKIILILFFVTACGSRKKEVEKKVEIKTYDEVLKDNSTINYKKDFNLTGVTYEPIDSDKPMTIDGKEFDNVKITQIEDKSKESAVIKNDLEKKIESKEIEKTKDTKIETSNKAIWLYGFLAIICIFFIYRYLK